MNRRISILYYWLTRKNNVRIGELAGFLFNPRMPRIATRHISRVEDGETYREGWASFSPEPLLSTVAAAGGR
jgi:hypothetical protein